MQAPILRTKRLILRNWQKSDLKPFAKMNTDPKVMEFFPRTLSKKESDNFVKLYQKEFTIKGYSLWALEIIGKIKFIGFVGLRFRDFEAPFTPCVEIGWRLASEHWGKGFATEGSKAALDYGF